MSQNLPNVDNKIDSLIREIEKEYIPDKRVEVFTIQREWLNDVCILSGETTNIDAHKVLIERATKITPNIEDKIRILPLANANFKKWGVVNNSVADFRAKAAYSSEMVTQVLLGMPLKILDKSGSWYRVQSPEGYIGWISGSISQLDEAEFEEYINAPKLMITSIYSHSFSEEDNSSLPVSDIVAGDMFVLIGQSENFYEVEYPDGRVAYVQIADAKEMHEWLNEVIITGDSIVDMAKYLMGVPYVWGGTSTKGLDCSGFTKLLFWLHGVVIARDASQQIKYGVEVDDKEDFEQLRKGDLLFFGEKATAGNPEERVVHVGFYIGNKQFIHASDNIHIGSLDPKSEIYDEYNAKRYLRTKRYIGVGDINGVVPIKDHPFYNH